MIIITESETVHVICC